ncbi:MAG TPA: caspase family protein [Bacteroidales bacterium]|nr:caspase family protein [Bacteroidales bacterium]HQG35932.1 caspase family protein [Bacteroidales bacterium]HQG53645.1 caspase family protein [Bacteroidales bacterium]HQJ20918.1 caspase family protein [Bacteroidales bacterium]
MKRRVVISVMLSLLAISVSFGQSGKKFYKAGNQFMAGMKYDDAIVQFTNAINAEPSNSNYYVARGNAYEMAGKLNEAFADFEKALVFKPKDVKTLISAGRVCNKLGKYDEALNYLNRAKSLDKMNKTLYPEKVVTLLGLELYDQALKASDTALIIKENAQNYYYRGKIYVKLNNSALAEKELKKAIAKDKNYAEPRIELADLYLRNNRQQEALDQINIVLADNPRNANAYIIRSRIYKTNLDYPNAINDISKTILIDPENPNYYFIRGTYYQEFNQHMNAIADFSKYISLKPDDPEAYFARAKSYEGMMNYEKAIEDYNKITALSEFDVRARKMLKDAQARLYELNRENVPPEINIVSPVITSNNKMEIKGNATRITISGNIKEKSKIDELLINNQKVVFGEKKNDISEFIATVDVSDTNKITISARDEYNNQRTLEFDLVRTEINPPEISIIVPYTSDDGQIYLENNSPRLTIEGKITDESKIKSIFIEGVTAGYAINDLNPSFTATIDILNKNKITVIAEDIYGNVKEAEFRLNREGSMLSSSNPMGKTWVVFIENSKYTSFAPLDGPVKDINMMTRALANYQIHQIIYKKDLTKAEMEKFFSIELRDLIKSNQVKSLLIWYAGHGKFINDVGYWIPVDAKRDDEFTYFNLNTLRASMETYVNYLTHTLVVTDACESGPSFYQAMRSDLKIRSCDDYTATQMKSAQVFSSAGYELAVDDSQFTRTFANTLANNPKSCLPIEEIVINVTKAVEENNQQKPKFGKITGLRDEDGTFFFIAK